MEIIAPRDSSDIARIGADKVSALLEHNPDAVLGLATGSSPIPLYSELIRRYNAGEVSFARAKGFILDEYLGLSPDHPQAYANVIRAEFTDHVDFPKGAVQTPDGFSSDIEGSCIAYEKRIRGAGGIDLQILGVGTDGHIGFNEPGSSLASRTRVKSLTPQTRQDNARFFDGDLDQVPIHCVTQGLGTIMEARQILLVALGEAKSQAVWNLLEGPVSTKWPVTVLQMHPNVTIFVDEGAASRLENLEYYRWAYETKPDRLNL